MFNVRLSHLPPMTFEDTTLLSLGIGLILIDLSRWRLSRMDCWVALFIFSTAYAERIPWGLSGALETLFGTVLACWVPYMAGKLLVERPGMRIETVRRIAVLMAVTSVFAMPQFFLKSNLYIYFWSHFFPGQWVNSGTREGFGRVDGPFGHGESAGMVFFIGLLLALWLQHCKTKNLGAIGYLGRPFKHGRIIILILATTLCMTQSRGPWLGGVIAVVIASIGRAKNSLRQAVLVFGSGLVVGIPLYSMGKDYVSGPAAQIGSEKQTAQYRMALIDNFVPIAKIGGAWGWGNIFPHPGGQESIDNEYLLVWVIQGYVGLTALILIFVEGTASFVRAAIKARSFEELYFILTLLGILLGLAVCVYTVWLAGIPYEMFFLIMGWSQALRSVDTGNQQQQDDKVTHELPRPDSVLVLT